MKDKIFNISNIIFENKELYGNFAKEKIVVEYGNENKRGKREEYLDDPKTERDVNTFLNHSKAKKMAIHIDCLNRTWKNRLLYNAIMFLVGTGVFFLIPSLGNIIVDAFSLNASVIGTLDFYLLTAVEIGLFAYVNQMKFYYNNEESKNLDKVKKDIDKANSILASISAYKEKEFTNSRERDNIDYRDTIRKNHNRNVDMYFETQKFREESRKRIDAGVDKRLEKMHKSSFDNISLNDCFKYSDAKVSRESKYKKGIKDTYRYSKDNYDETSERVRKR